MSPHDLDLSIAFVQLQPKAAARELELQEPQAVAPWINCLPLRDAKSLMAHLLPSYTAYLCVFMAPEKIISLLEDLSSNHIAAVLRYLSKDQRATLFEYLPERKSVLCRLLLNYSEDMVGAWMKADILMIPAGIDVAHGLQRLSLHHGYVNSDALPIVDDNHRLQGQVSVKRLLAAKAGTSLIHLLEPVDHALQTRASLATVIKHPLWQSQDSVFVVDREQQLSGELRHADLRTALQGLRERDDDIGRTNHLLDCLGEAYGASLMSLLSLIGDSLNQPNNYR